jgi:hypothetical protein
MTTLTYLYELHNIYKSWLNELALADDEIMRAPALTLWCWVTMHAGASD